MSLPSSGICFHADATNGRQHHLGAGLTIEGPFTSLQLVLRFPRWVPGSYFLREPIQHMFDFSATDDAGRDLSWKRVGVDGISVRLRKASTAVRRLHALRQGTERPLQPPRHDPFASDAPVHVVLARARH